MSALKHVRFGLVAAAGLLACNGVVAQPALGTAPPVQAVEASDPSQQEYILGAEDVIEVGIIGAGEKNRVRIYSDGTIQLPLVGSINAANRTPRELGEDLSKVYKSGGYFADPVVTVEVVGYASRYVTVLGAVSSPGLVPINRVYHLSEVLARVGGVKESAADYLVVRAEGGGEKRYSIKRLASGGSDDDPIVSAGDKIFSPQAEIFYISGQVNSPGSYPLKTDMTIAQAIAQGGGVTESGSDKSVKVRRDGKTIKLKGDALVEPGDVLTISERLF